MQSRSNAGSGSPGCLERSPERNELKRADWKNVLLDLHFFAKLTTFGGAAIKAIQRNEDVVALGDGDPGDCRRGVGGKLGGCPG